MAEYPDYPPLPGGAAPPIGYGPRPEPWETPGNHVPPALSPPTVTMTATVRRMPVGAWLAIVSLLVFLAATFVWAIDLRSQRDQLRRQVTGGSVGTVPGASPGTAGPGTGSASLEATIERLEKETERIREHTFTSKLRVEIVPPSELADRLTQANARDVDTTKLAAEGRRLGLLGVIPPSVAARYPDYLNALFREQVAGFYDSLTKELVVGAASGDLKVTDRITTVHELTHALTDQAFDFGPKTDALDKQGRDEELAAFVAVLEGDATLAMTLYARQFLDPKDLAGGFGEIPSTPLFDSAPRFVRDSVLFPYNEGLSFVQDAYDQGGWKSVDELYKTPPTTTEQILHPDKYGAKEGARPVDLPDIDLGPGWRKTATSVIGEFQLRELLVPAMSDADAARGAAGWGGDSFAQYENGSNLLLALRIVADSPAAATGMNTAINRFLDRWKRSNLRGGSSLSLTGDTITLVLSTDPAAATAATQRLGG